MLLFSTFRLLQAAHHSFTSRDSTRSNLILPFPLDCFDELRSAFSLNHGPTLKGDSAFDVFFLSHFLFIDLSSYFFSWMPKEPFFFQVYVFFSSIQVDLSPDSDFLFVH